MTSSTYEFKFLYLNVGINFWKPYHAAFRCRFCFWLVMRMLPLFCGWVIMHRWTNSPGKSNRSINMFPGRRFLNALLIFFISVKSRNKAKNSHNNFIFINTWLLEMVVNETKLMYAGKEITISGGRSSWPKIIFIPSPNPAISTPLGLYCVT